MANVEAYGFYMSISPAMRRPISFGVYKKNVKLDLKKSETEGVRKLIVELRNELKQKYG